MTSQYEQFLEGRIEALEEALRQSHCQRDDADRKRVAAEIGLEEALKERNMAIAERNWATKGD